MMQPNKIFSALLILLAGTMFSCRKEETKVSKITFENLPLDESGVYNGADLAGGFTCDNAYFPNHYDTEYNFWSGFSYTRLQDNQTRGYLNQYSAIAGEGADGSSQYAVLYTFSEDTVTFNTPQLVSSLSVCNTTYSYYTMLEGDDFTDPFGGQENVKDYFHLIVKGLNENKELMVNVKVKLADFTSAESFISNAWTELDLSDAGYLKYLTFSFDSSDPFIPTYACIDNIFGELRD